MRHQVAPPLKVPSSSRLLNISGGGLRFLDIQALISQTTLPEDFHRLSNSRGSSIVQQNIAAMVAQSAKFKQAVTDSKKLKAKPTDDELLEVRSHSPPKVHKSCKPPVSSGSLAISDTLQLYAFYKQGIQETKFEDAPKPGTFDFKVSHVAAIRASFCAHQSFASTSSGIDREETDGLFFTGQIQVQSLGEARRGKDDPRGGPDKVCCPRGEVEGNIRICGIGRWGSLMTGKEAS